MDRAAKTKKLLAIVVCLLMPSLNCYAQDVDSIDGLRKEQLLDITINGSAPGVPALRHRLYPALDQLLRRNAAMYYHRAAFSLSSIRSGIRQQNLRRTENPIQGLDTHSNFDLWMNSPLNEMPVDDMRSWLDRHQDVFADLSRAKVSQHCEWGILPDPSEKMDAYSVMMHELQQMRSICRMLTVAIRVAAYDKDFDTAIEHLQTGYKIARDVSQCKSLVASLVGIACAGIMMEQQTMLIQQPGSPNLYWPLVDLPDPLSDVRLASRHEIGLLSGPNCMMKTFRDPEHSTMTSEGWRKSLVSDFGAISAYVGLDEQKAASVIGTLALRGYAVAKQSLIENGYEKAVVDQMPVIQVIAIHEKRQNEFVCHEYLKALNLPYDQAIQHLHAIEEKMETQFVNPSMAGKRAIHEMSIIPFLEFLLPAMPQVLIAEARTSRNMAALRTIEAIRAHVAETGTLPTALAEITIVPVPMNPATGKPFDYQLNIDGAALKDYGYAKFSWKYYQIRLAK